MTSLGFLMGFCMYGAISLLGTIAVEVAPIHMTGTAHGIIGLTANSKWKLHAIPLHFTQYYCMNNR